MDECLVYMRESKQTEELLRALEQIGKPAIPELLRCLESGLEGNLGDDSPLPALVALDRVYPGHSEGRGIEIQPLLEALRDDRAQTAEVRQIACELLEKL